MIKYYKRFDLYDKMLIEKVILEPPYMAKALMPNEACFLYTIQGCSHVYSSTEDMMMHTKEGVVMKCGNFLNEWLETSPGNTCEAIAVHFYPEVMRKIYDKELPEFVQMAQRTKPVAIQKVKANELLQKYIESLQFYFENPSLVSDDLLKLKVKELILLLVKTDNSRAIQQLISSLFTPDEYSFKEVIEANIYNNLTNEDLSILCSMSLSSFKRDFEKAYQTSPAKYFKKRKLDRAAELLRHTKQRIGDIAFNCGFSDVSHFSKSFQKHFDVSPSNYRNQPTKAE